MNNKANKNGNNDIPVNISNVGKTAYDDKYAMDDEPDFVKPVSAAPKSSVKAERPSKPVVDTPKPEKKEKDKKSEEKTSTSVEQTVEKADDVKAAESVSIETPADEKPKKEKIKKEKPKKEKQEKPQKEKKEKGGLFGKANKKEAEKPAAIKREEPAKAEPTDIAAETPVIDAAPIENIEVPVFAEATVLPAEPVAELTEATPVAEAEAVSENVEPVASATEDKPKKKKFDLLGIFKKKKDELVDGVKLEKGSTKIKYRILRLSIISVIGSVIIMQLYSTISTISSYQNNYTEQAKALVTSYMQTLDTKMDAMTLQLSGLKSNSAMLTVTDSNVLLGSRKAKLTELATSTMFKFIDYADMEGNTLSETNIADREYFIRAKEGINTFSSPLVRRQKNTEAVDESVMILGIKFNNGTSQGILTGGIDPRDLSTGFDSISEGNNVVVLDKNGLVIAATDMSLVTSGVNYLEHEQAGYKKLAESMLTNESGTIRYNANGTEYLAAYSPIELTDGWTIAVSLNYSKVTSEIFMNVIIALGMAVVVIALTSFIGVRVANKISKPITVVATRLHQLSHGDISTEFNMEAPKDETKVLTDSLTSTITELNKYISDIKTVLAEIADGDLTAKSKIEYLGDFTAIGTSLEQITFSLNNSFAAVKASVDSIKSGAAQVADGSQHLSDTATKQAEAVDEILSTIGGITEQANSTAQASTKVLTITNEANENAQRGADMMKELLVAIQNMKDKSDAISAVIKTIDSIAFQTNILALNASIEAARAGEAGRGFSVVAQEVGNLASMSADAVKQTASLINDSMAAVDQGTAIADRAENAIRSIAADVNQVAGYMGDIVTAANEQNVAVEQITTGIHRIDSGMHLTTSTAEESAASSQQLSDLAVSLSNEVERFKTE